MNLIDKYRPRRIDDVLGQPEVVRALRSFVQSPHVGAFLFAGPTGTGKTSAAYCLAADLGILVDRGEFGGLWQIASGEQTADSVRNAIDALRVTAWAGSGWKMLVVNECDRMSEAAAFVWLDALESLPKKSVVVFTTNDIAGLPQRLRDRCQTLMFTGNPESLKDDANFLVRRVWREELGRDDAPDVDALGDWRDEDGNASFRRVLQQLAPIIRADGRMPERELPPWWEFDIPPWMQTEWATTIMLALLAGGLSLVAGLLATEPGDSNSSYDYGFDENRSGILK